MRRDECKIFPDVVFDKGKECTFKPTTYDYRKGWSIYLNEEEKDKLIKYFKNKEI